MNRANECSDCRIRLPSYVVKRGDDMCGACKAHHARNDAANDRLVELIDRVDAQAANDTTEQGVKRGAR